jgi:hypothetical protein
MVVEIALALVDHDNPRHRLYETGIESTLHAKASGKFFDGVLIFVGDRHENFGGRPGDSSIEGDGFDLASKNFGKPFRVNFFR